MVDEADIWSGSLRPDRTSEPAVRVVLAEEAAAPGPLAYLLEGEGFQILGCATNDNELARVLAHATPDVIVLDADVPSTSVFVARERAPSAEVIVIWPDGVLPPASADQVFPRLVYQDLGAAVLRAAERGRLRHPVVDEPAGALDVADPDLELAESSGIAARRTAARVLVGTVALIASIIVTMGVSFALEGWRASHVAAPPRTASVAPTPSVVGRSTAPGSAHPTQGATRQTKPSCDANSRTGPNAHASKHAPQQAPSCPSNADGGGHPSAGGQGGGQGNDQGTGQGGQGNDQGTGQDGQGNDQGTGQGTGQGDQGTGQGDQGDQGGSQGDQGGGQGDQGGGQTPHAPDQPSGPPTIPGAGRATPKG